MTGQCIYAIFQPCRLPGVALSPGKRRQQITRQKTLHVVWLRLAQVERLSHPAAQSSPPTTTSTITSTSAALLISPLQSTSSVESSSTSTSTSTSSTSLASTALPTSDELFESSPALSQDALIGLIVGVILAALAIIGVVVFVILRRQRRPPSSPSVAPSPARKSEYAAAPSLYNSSQYDVAPGLTSEYDAASSAFVR
jgi:beta-lactamase regulating signal transducer with metallopeptidase domain